jgi:hypothetical protein
MVNLDVNNIPFFSLLLLRPFAPSPSPLTPSDPDSKFMLSWLIVRLSGFDPMSPLIVGAEDSWLVLELETLLAADVGA